MGRHRSEQTHHGAATRTARFGPAVAMAGAVTVLVVGASMAGGAAPQSAQGNERIALPPTVSAVTTTDTDTDTDTEQTAIPQPVTVTVTVTGAVSAWQYRAGRNRIQLPTVPPRDELPENPPGDEPIDPTTSSTPTVESTTSPSSSTVAELSTTTPSPTDSTPEPTTAAPTTSEPSTTPPPTSTSSPTDSTPEPTTSEPSPTESTPEPTTDEPSPTGSTPEPTTDEPSPTESTPEPTTSEPSSTATSTTTQPTTSRSTPKPTTTAPKPTTTTPKPTTTTPKPTTTTPKPTTTTPKPPAPAPAPGRTVKFGNVVVTTPGTVIDNMEIRGRLIIQAANVTVNNSLITGPEDPASAGRGGIVQNTRGFPNLVIKNSTVLESHQSGNNTECVVGSNFTLENSTVKGCIDNVQIRGSNVTIRNSTLKDTVKYAHDSAQGGGPSHSDNVQVLQGDNILIEGNTITGSQNFAVLGASEQAAMMNLRVRNNFVDGGGWTMKFSNKTLTGSMNPQSVFLQGNRFGGHSSEGVDLVVARGTNFTDQGGNVRTDGKPVQISWVNSGQ